MSRKASTKDTAARNLQSCEPARGPVPFVVMCPTFGKSGTHRQERLSLIQCLNLGLLVHAQNKGLFWWIHVEADHISQLLLESRALLNLNVVVRCRSSPHLFQIRPTDAGLTFVSFASLRVLQCVACRGGVKVLATIDRLRASEICRGRPLRTRVLRPDIPCALYR